MASYETANPAKPDRVMIVLDDKGIVSVWDRAAETHLGYSADEAIGKRLCELASPEMLALPSPELIKEHSKLYGRYQRYHMVGKKSGRFFLAEVVAQIEPGPSRECLTFIWIRPAESRSSYMKNGAGKQTSQGDSAGDLLHEFNNLLMVLFAQAEMLGDHSGKDEASEQHAKLLTEAAVRMKDVWTKLQAFIEFWKDMNTSEAGPGASPQDGNQSRTCDVGAGDGSAQELKPQTQS